MNYSGIIIERSDGKCLFQLRSKKDKDFAYKWGLFGGHSRKNEKPLITINREIKEELDYSLDNEKVKEIFSLILPFFKIHIYHTNINHKRMGLIDGEKMKYFYPSEMVLKKNVVFLMRLFFLFYPVIKLFSG